MRMKTAKTVRQHDAGEMTAGNARLGDAGDAKVGKVWQLDAGELPSNRTRQRGVDRMALGLRRDERGQSTVELALAIPVMLIAAVIAYNALVFFGDCATFDRAFKDAVRVYASSEPYQVSSSAESQVRRTIQTQLDDNCTVRVSSSATVQGFTRYVATLSYTPTLFGRQLRGDIFGVSLACPEHTSTFTIDTFVTG